MTSNTSDEACKMPETPDGPPLTGMAWIPGGLFRMGSEDFYPEERPVHEVSVDGFWMDCHEVTNEQFALFVEATGYKTLAERPLNPTDFPGAPTENLVPGSMLFHKTKGPVDLGKYFNWWASAPGTMELCPAARRWPIVGRESFPGRICSRMASRELPLSAPFRRTATVCTIWLGMCGNGLAIGLCSATPMRVPALAAARQSIRALPHLTRVTMRLSRSFASHAKLSKAEP